jgi:hypothetical protein
MLGAAQSLMTPELAEFFSAWLIETLPDAPPVTQRSTGEWLLEQLALQALPGVEQSPAVEPPLDGEGDEA